MYNRFFGFTERPFKLVPNPAFLYLSRVHQEVLAHLNYAVGYGEGFVAITGEVGTGKTTLCRMFLESLDESTAAAYIFNPKLDALQLLKSINDEFGIDATGETVKVLIDRLNAFLLAQKAQGRRVILLVDEAQNLSVDVLEQLRLLSNLETTSSKLLQIILVGQPELNQLLESDSLRQLSQRITLSYHLIPLDLNETREYIRHRIHVASSKPGLEFTSSAYRSIYRHSGGTPRLINITCDRALLTAYTLGKHRITNAIVKQALRELTKKRSARGAMLLREKLTIGLLAMLVLLVAGLVIAQFRAVAPTNIAPPPLIHRKIVPPPPPLEPDLPAASEEDPVAAEPASRGPVEPVGQEVVQPAPASRSAALGAVLQAWKIPVPKLPGESADNGLFFKRAAHLNGMELLRVQGNLNLIRKLNLPAIVEFPNPDKSGVRFLAVLAFVGDEIQLSHGQRRFALSSAVMNGMWNGVAYICWKDHYHYKGVIPSSSSGETIMNLKRQLAALGFDVGEMDAAYNLETRQAIETIQDRAGLDADGMVGPQTKIVLYNADPSLDIPRLDDSVDR